MPDMNTPHTLRALSHVKDIRKSLAEAEYLRRLRQQRDLQQDCDAHEQRLAHSKSVLPQQKAAILAGLAARPVGVRKIHSAHETVRTLHRQIELLEQERQALAIKHDEAFANMESAHRNFTVATRKLQKFQDIKTRNDALTVQQSNEQEQAELEDRPYTRPDSIQPEGK